jgi:hypothetical protein
MCGVQAWLGLYSTQKESIQMVLLHTGVFTAVLEQKTGECGCDQPVLVPMGVFFDELAHSVEQHFRYLSFEADRSMRSVNGFRCHQLGRNKDLDDPVRHGEVAVVKADGGKRNHLATG